MTSPQMAFFYLPREVFPDVFFALSVAFQWAYSTVTASCAMAASATVSGVIRLPPVWPSDTVNHPVKV